MTNLNEEIIVPEKVLSEKTGISTRTLQAWRAKGNGPKFIKISARMVRYKMSDFYSWLKEKESLSTCGKSK